MTVKELFKFAKRHNLEDADLEFQDGYHYDINHAKLIVSNDFPGQIKVILSE